jgi:hypothetical protein
MMKRLVSSLRVTSRWQAVLLLAGCSFQSFDYLEEASGSGGSGGAGAGGTTISAGSGNPQAGSNSPAEGGMGEPSRAGSSGGPSEAGKGGSGGSEPLAIGGVPASDGGAGGVAGDGTGNENTGAVGQLVNPSFETSNTLGWTVEPTDALTKRHAFVQVPQGTATVPDGGYEFSTWHMTDAFAVEVSQTITGLEDGTYTFKGYFSRGDGFNSVSIFARNCGGEVDPEPVAVPLTDPSQWLNVELTGIEVLGGSCDVGLSIDSNPTNWLNADLFTFEKEAE